MFLVQSGNSIVVVDGLQIKIINVTTLTMTATIRVVTRARKNNAYIKWLVSLSVLMIEPIATSV
jgi:predicted transposase YbfD/YdcC